MVSTRSGMAAAAASPRRGGNWNRLQILVVMTWKPAGSAMIAGEPNMVSDCRMAINVPASMAGSTSGMVTLRSVVIQSPPRMDDASSRSDGTLSSALATRVKT